MHGGERLKKPGPSFADSTKDTAIEICRCKHEATRVLPRGRRDSPNAKKGSLDSLSTIVRGARTCSCLLTSVLIQQLFRHRLLARPQEDNVLAQASGDKLV